MYIDGDLSMCFDIFGGGGVRGEPCLASERARRAASTQTQGRARAHPDEHPQVAPVKGGCV